MSDLGSDYEEEEQGPYLGVGFSKYIAITMSCAAVLNIGEKK